MLVSPFYGKKTQAQRFYIILPKVTGQERASTKTAVPNCLTVGALTQRLSEQSTSLVNQPVKQWHGGPQRCGGGCLAGSKFRDDKSWSSCGSWGTFPQQRAKALKCKTELIKVVTESPSREGFLPQMEDRFSSVWDGLHIVLCEGQ